jgi:hypothetical protein
VEDVRRTRTRGGGPKNWDRVDVLGGLLECVCGRRLRNDGTFADGRHRKHHANPCEAWGGKDRLGDATWEAPVLAQVAGIALDEQTMASVVAALGSSRQLVEIDKARVDRQIRELALEHAAESMGDDAYLARLKVGRGQRDAIAERTAAGLPGQRAVEWLRALGESLQATDASKEKADLMHAIYDRITVAGPEIVGVRLTQAACAHGLALVLAERLNWRARQVLGAGLQPTRSRSRAGMSGSRRRGGWRERTPRCAPRHGSRGSGGRSGSHRRIGEGSRSSPWLGALDRQAPLGERPVEGRGDDDRAARLDPRPSAGRARWRGPSG